MSAVELLNAVYGRWPTDEATGVLDLAASNWEAIRARPLTAEDGETCRQAMLAAVGLGRYLEGARWRARAMSRFIATDWKEGAISVVMTDAFRVLEMANDGYPRGKTVDVLLPSEDAMEILSELRPFATGEARPNAIGPDPALIARFMHEKRGFFLVLAERWDEAVASYDEALKYVENERRGELKVGAGRALALYLQDVADGGDGRVAAGSTAAIAKAARDHGVTDVAKVAEANLPVMRTGGGALRPYEIL